MPARSRAAPQVPQAAVLCHRSSNLLSTQGLKKSSFGCWRKAILRVITFCETEDWPQIQENRRLPDIKQSVASLNLRQKITHL
ncbi:MAG: hypothetical protein ACKVY0_30760, partial [Prosthecobacter sp.]|uniref:hypothetical protein n=1 Tax=Prosthecobacter sp. TaxID=1965333 RepID=UPI0039029ABF